MKAILSALLVFGLVFLSGCAAKPGAPTVNASITDFDSCVAAGGAVMESFPRQCRAPDGQAFVCEEEAAQVRKRSCCRECTAAFSQSPVAMGPAAARCGHFMTGNPISAECEGYFEESPATVDECGDSGEG